MWRFYSVPDSYIQKLFESISRPIRAFLKYRGYPLNTAFFLFLPSASKKSLALTFLLYLQKTLCPDFFSSYCKKSKGRLFGDKKIRKKSHIAQKIEKGDSLVPSGFVGYVLNVKNQKRGPFGIT